MIFNVRIWRFGEGPATGFVKMRTKSSKIPSESVRHLRKIQDLSGEHTGAVWTMKFSSCGRLLATAGQDRDIRIWVLKEHIDYFEGLRVTSKPYNRPQDDAHNSPGRSTAAADVGEADTGPFHPRPFCRYAGHDQDVLDLSWSHSRNYFLLSSSMDKTVRLWHISRAECLALYKHNDFVTAIAFHPR